MLFTRSWWIASLQRAGRTALILITPFVPSIVQGDYLPALLAGVFGFITSFATSRRDLPEVVGKVVPWWKATVERMVKSAAQGLVTGIGTASVLSEVDWSITLDLVLAGAVGSLLLSLLSALPETTPGEDVPEEYDDEDPPVDDDDPDDEDLIEEGGEVKIDRSADPTSPTNTLVRDSVSGYLVAPYDPQAQG